jgi:hypothetical protein
VCFVQQRLILLLNQIYEPAVVGEIDLLEFGAAIDAQPFQHSTLETANQKVGQEEGARLLVHKRLKGRSAIHLVAVRAGDARHVVALQHGIELSTGAAIAIDYHNAREPWDQLTQPALDVRADAGRKHVIERGHAEQRNIPMMALGDRDHLAGERAAQDKRDLREF